MNIIDGIHVEDVDTGQRDEVIKKMANALYDVAREGRTLEEAKEYVWEWLIRQL